MKPEQMKERSAEKMKQVLELMKILHIRVEAKQVLTQNGFLENTVYWIDDEKYPAEPVVEIPPAVESAIEKMNEAAKEAHDA